MKKRLFSSVLLLVVCSTILTSCLSYTSVVGEGAKGNVEVTKWNHYVLFGLFPVSRSDSREMAGGAKSYTINTTYTFWNGLIAGLTFGIYLPTTTTVTK